MSDALICQLADFANRWGTMFVTLVIFGVGVALSLAMSIARFAMKRFEPNTKAPGPPWMASALIALIVYVFARLLDPLLKSRLTRPSEFPEDVWTQVGYFEWKLLGDRWAWPLLPLDARPALALMLHAVVWALVIALTIWILRRLPGGRDGYGKPDVEVQYDTTESEVPWFYRWVGSTTAHGADQRFKKWSRGLMAFLVPLHLAAGMLVASAAPAASSQPVNCTERIVESLVLPPEALDQSGKASVQPAAGAWILTYYLLFFWSLHLILAGRPPAVKEEEEEEKEDEEEEVPPPDPLAKLGEAVIAIRPEARLEALQRVEGKEAETTELPEGTGPVVNELCLGLTGGNTLYAHQREVLDHLISGWHLSSEAARGATPSLEEEVLRSPIRRRDETPHALVLAAEGSGRTTLAVLATLHMHFDRGATTLVVLSDRGAARAWADHFREALLRSAARWNVHVCVAGDDLSAALVAGKTPSVVVADVETFEGEVLSDPRSDAYVDRLGLVIVDDLDEMSGVTEMHLHMAMRRLWALVDTRRHAESTTSYPLVLLATAGPSTAAESGVESWARHVLAAPMRVFERNGAPQVPRVVLRRRDLVDAQGQDLPLHVLAEACDAAAIPWHMRLAGDGQRTIRRAEIDLGRLRRHHVDDPRDAEVILIEGRHPDVHREAERLAHAGVNTEGGAAVLVLAPPADEEMVLHEEADDAPLRPLVESLPRSVTLSEPDVVRQRHFDRALGREHDVEALRRRFGRGFVDDALGRLERVDRIRSRQVWYFDRRKDDAAARTLVRAVREAALGEPIDHACVSDSAGRLRVIDQGTSEELAVVDRAVAFVRYAPGRVFLHPRGRYQVVGYGEGTVIADHATDRCRTTPDIELDVTLPADLELSERQLGGDRTRVTCVRADIEERVTGMRRYGPGPVLEEHRRYEQPSRARYATDLCLVSTQLETRAGTTRAPLERNAIVPLCAALRMVIPCALRGSDDLVDVGSVRIGEVEHLVFYDRTPGASGFAEWIARDGLKDLLLLARMVLERLVGAELVRLRRIHDTSADGDQLPWDFAAALTFLDAALDPPPSERRAQRTPRVEYTPGEGSEGDLGRVWMSRSGRTDDLVWTRHSWERNGAPVHFDVAVERRAIMRAIGDAARAEVSKEPAAPRVASEWVEAHQKLMTTGQWELEVMRDQLEGIAGDHMVDMVVGLVAAIPTRGHALSPVERTPLAVLARRRGDVDAKTLAAFALLPARTEPSILVGDAGCYLRAGGRTWDLSGPAPAVVEPEGVELALR